MRAPVRSFVAGGSVVALAVFVAVVLTWTLARDAAPESGARGSAPTSSSASASTSAPIVLRAILELPSPTTTDTPQSTATSSPDPASGLNFCATATPGALCKVAYPPPPPPTAYPRCATAVLAPGDWCRWNGTPTVPTGTPATGTGAPLDGAPADTGA